MRPAGGWKSVNDVEIAVAEYVDWFNHRRLHGEIGLVPPTEFESTYWDHTTTTTTTTTTKAYSLSSVPTGAGNK